MARRNDHTQGELRELILDAAQNIIVEHGLSALTARKVAANINYTVGSIYMFFTNMDDLIIHLKAAVLDEIAAQLDLIHHTSSEPFLEEMAKTYLRFASQNFNRWSMIFEHRLPANKNHPIWYTEKTEDSYRRVEAQFKLLTPNCTNQQIYRAARALWSGIHGICALSLNDRVNHLDIYDIESHIVLLVRNFVNGWVQAANGDD